MCFPFKTRHLTLNQKLLAAEESAAIMIYLSEKYQRFFPNDPRSLIGGMGWVASSEGSGDVV